MIAKIKLSNLKKLIKRSKNLINDKSPMPILHNFLLKCEKGKLTVIATDLDSTLISSEIVEDIREEGSIVIPAKRFSDLVMILKNDVVTLKADNNLKLEIIVEDGHYTLSGISPSDFPKIQYPSDDDYIISFKGHYFKYLVDYSIFAVSKDIGILTGVNLEIFQSSIRMVGTDSHKLGLCEITNNVNNNTNDFSFPIKFTIPAKTIKHLSDNIEDESELKIASNGNFVIFMFDDVKLSSRVLEGNYPNYEVVIPKENKNIAQINREEFLYKIESACVMSETNQHKIVFKFDTQLKIKSFNSEIGGESDLSMNIKYTGEEIETAFNGNYLIEMLKNIKTEEVEIYMNTPINPVIIKPIPMADDHNVVLLLMPLRIK